MIDPREQICLYCFRIPKCQLLEDGDGHFDPGKPITPESQHRCEQWIPVRWLTREVRDQLHDRSGSGSLRGLYLLPDLVATKLEKLQEETYEMTEVVDLASIIKPGMTAHERREQLRYVTDEDGNVELDKDGKPTPRNSHEYRFFAISEDHHVGLNVDTGLFWRADEVLDYIVNREIELGLVVDKDRKKSKTKAGTARETKEMGKTVVRRSGKSSSASDKDTKETKKSGRPRRSGTSKSPPAAAGSGADLSEIEATISALKEAVAALAEKVENVGDSGGGGEGNDAYDVATNLHGVLRDFMAGLAGLANESVEVLDDIANEFNLAAEEDGESDE
jgi:hypothetical protein